MKNIIKLGMLAVLANVSVHANTVNFLTVSPLGTDVNSFTKDNVVITGYKYDTGYIGILGTAWAQSTVHANATGVGVSGGNFDASVEGTYREFLLLDFGSTLTGAAKVDTLSLYFPNYLTAGPGNPYFRYSWISTPPAGNPANPSIGSLTDWTDNTYSVPANGVYTFGSPLAGSGRYLLIGATNGALTTTNYFQLQSLTYTSVPDGASTLALMGAALATLGFTARRRKA